MKLIETRWNLGFEPEKIGVTELTFIFQHLKIYRKAANPTGNRELEPVRTGTGGTGTRNRTGNLEILEIWKSGNFRNPRNLEIDRILEIPEF